MVQDARRRHRGKIPSAALKLGISRPTLYELMEKLANRLGFVMEASNVPRGSSVFVGSSYDHNETRSLPVNHRRRAVCRQTSKGGANGYVGILYKYNGEGFGTRGLMPGDSNPPRHHKWMESIELGSSCGDSMTFRELVAPQVHCM